MSHERLAYCCHVYFELKFPDFNNHQDTRDRILYNDLLYHIDRAALQTPQDSFLKAFPLTQWIQKHSMLKPTPSPELYRSPADLLYILADRNVPRLVEMVLDRDSKINVRGQRYGYPFYAALVHGYEDVVEAPLH